MVVTLLVVMCPAGAVTLAPVTTPETGVSTTPETTSTGADFQEVAIAPEYYDDLEAGQDAPGSLPGEVVTVELNLTEYVGTGAVQLKFEDYWPSDGWGPLLHRTTVEADGAVVHSFEAGTDEERDNYLAENGGSDGETYPWRFADAEQYWIYEFTVPEDADSLTVTLEIANGFRVLARSVENSSISGDVSTLSYAGGSVDPSVVPQSTTVDHDVTAEFRNVSMDGDTDRFYLTVPDAVAGSNLSFNDVTVVEFTNGTPLGSGVNVSTVDGPDGDSVMDTLRFELSPEGTGSVDVAANVSVGISWPAVPANTTYTLRTAAEDSKTGNVSLRSLADVTVTSPNSAPVASFSINDSEPTVEDPVELNASASTDPDGNVTTYEWDLDGDGEYDDATGARTVTNFSISGSQSVGVRVTDGAGASGTTHRTISVRLPLSANFSVTPETPTVNESVTLRASGGNVNAPATRLEAYYSLDGDTVTNAVTGRDAPVQTATPGAGGVVGGAWEFATDGTSDTTADAVVSEGLPINGESATVGAWVNVTDTESFSRIFQVGGDLGTYPTEGWNIEFDGSNNEIYLVNWDDGPHIGQRQTITLDPHRWYYVATVVNGTDARMHVFDQAGELNASPVVWEGLGPRGDSETAPLLLMGGDGRDTAGRMDEVRAYSRALSRTEIERLHHARSSRGASRENVSYEWDLDGDGQYDDATGVEVTTRFGLPGDRTAGLRVTDDGETVTNTETVTVTDPPSAAFSVNVSDPRVNEPVRLDATNSTDSDGTIVSHDWDLDGDGIYEASGETVTTNFSTPGTVTVSLRVTDDDGVSDTASEMIHTTELLSAERTIQGPVRPGGRVNVTVRVTPDADVNGPAVDENIPEPLSIVSQSTAPGATYRESANQWLWLQASKGRTLTVNYTIAVPETVARDETFSLAGSVSSGTQSPVEIGGDTTLEVETCINHAVAGPDGEITLPELQSAINWWAEDEPVPDTGGQTLSLPRLQNLINAWAEDQPVSCQG
jgi:hypothetical protein